jgi:hypothetical protein
MSDREQLKLLNKLCKACGQHQVIPKSMHILDCSKGAVEVERGGFVRADCLATNTEYCDRCTHAATQATNVARIKTEGTKGLLQGQMAG